MLTPVHLAVADDGDGKHPSPVGGAEHGSWEEPASPPGAVRGIPPTDLVQCCKGFMVAAHVLVASLLVSDTGVWTPTVVLGPAGWLCSTLWSRGLQAVQMGTRRCAFGPLLVSDGGSVFGQPSGACAAVVAAVPRRGVSVGFHAIVARSPVASHGSGRLARLGWWARLLNWCRA